MNLPSFFPKQIGKRVKNEIKIYNNNLGEKDEPLSISIGVATCNNDCQSLEKVMDKADKRMYKNKYNKKKKENTKNAVYSTK
jgi:GGDEF domain-containing protein